MGRGTWILLAGVCTINAAGCSHRDSATKDLPKPDAVTVKPDDAAVAQRSDQEVASTDTGVPQDMERMDQFPIGDTSLGEMSLCSYDLTECLVRFGESLGQDRDDLLMEFDSAIKYIAGPKVLYVALPSREFWCVPMVKAVQKEFLAVHGDWQVELWCPEPFQNVRIHPDKVSLLEGDSIANLNEHFMQMGAATEADKEKWQGWLRRQRAALQDQLRQGIPSLTSETPFVLMGVFNAYRKPDYHVAWLLTGESDGRTYLHTPGHEAARDKRLYIDAEGTINDKSWKFVNGSRTDIDYRWKVESWLIPRDFDGPELIVAQDEEEIDGVIHSARQWRIPFSRSQIIHD